MNRSIIDVTSGGGNVGANAPAIIFLPKNSLVSQECVIWGEDGEKGCICIKERYTQIYIFLN
jgi:hypothetical protein